MSCFEGCMKEYRRISIDRFDKDNLQSTVFFLSHCHRDHMVGLNHQGFLRHLKNHNDIFLYCSEVTKILLLSENIYKPLEKFVRVLEIGQGTTVTIPDPAHQAAEKYESVMATALPAGHCPGSVMLLFEGHEGTALYTGDFRWEKNYATTLPALCVNGHLKEIDSMYVDTTFCMPEAFHIPSRDQCLSATTSLVLPWLQKSPHHYVIVSSKTRYGHEPLLAHLAKEADTLIHVEKAKVEIYEQIAELKGFFTSDPSTRIHACNWVGSGDAESLPCGYKPPPPHKDSSAPCSSAGPSVLVIRPSTMWFTAEPSRLQELVASPSAGSGVHRVCFSFHSSYSEVRDFVSLLRPRQVFPNVLPPSDSTWEPVTARLRSFLTFPHKQHQTVVEETTRPLGLLKKKRRTSSLSQSDLDGLVFDSQEKKNVLKSRGVSREENPDFCQDDNNLSTESPEKNSQSDLQSSYQASCPDEDLFDNDSHSTTASDKRHSPECVDQNAKNGVKREYEDREESADLRSYVSGDEEMPEEDRLSSPKFQHLSSQDDVEKDILGPSPELVSKSKHQLQEASNDCCKRLKLEEADETEECEQVLQGKPFGGQQSGVGPPLQNGGSSKNGSERPEKCQELSTWSRELQNRSSCSEAYLGTSVDGTTWAVLHIPEKTMSDQISPKAEKTVLPVDLHNHTEKVQGDKINLDRDSLTNSWDCQPEERANGASEEKTTPPAAVPSNTEAHLRSSSIAAGLATTVASDLTVTVHHDKQSENNLVLTVEDARSPTVQSPRNAITSPDTLSTESEKSIKHAGSKIVQEVSEGFCFGKQALNRGIQRKGTNIQSTSAEDGAPEKPTQCVELVLSSSNSPCEVNDPETSPSPIIYPVSLRTSSDFKTVGKKGLDFNIFNVDENLHDADVEDNVDDVPRKKTKLSIPGHNDDDIQEVIVIDDHSCSLDAHVRRIPKCQCSKGNLKKVKHLPSNRFPSLLSCTKTKSESPKQIARQSQANCRIRGHPVQTEDHMSKSKQNGNNGSVLEGDNSVQVETCSDSDETLPPESPIAIVDSDSNSGLVAVSSSSKRPAAKIVSANSQKQFFIDLTEDDG